MGSVRLPSPRIRLARWLTAAVVGGLLAGCQYLQPRSVDEIEKGRLPAGVQRTDSRAPAAPAAPVKSGKPAGQAPASADAVEGRSTAIETEQLVARREQAAQSAVLVLSAGAIESVGFRTGSTLSLDLVEPKSGARETVNIDLGCTKTVCQAQTMTLGDEPAVVQSSLRVTRLPEGRWQVRSVSVVEKTTRGGTEMATVNFSKPLSFRMRNGYATYLGAFTVTAGLPPPADGTSGQGARLPLLRSSNLEPDMARALADFPETRGRRMLNEVQGMLKPQPVN